MLPVLIVCATRSDPPRFERESMLGQSLARLSFNPAIRAAVCFGNTRGLPEVYNAEIAPKNAGTVLVFVHDDVWIDDFFLQERLHEALAAYDVVGLAGNKVLHPGQSAWAFPPGSPNWDRPENLSGAVAHVRESRSSVTWFGPSGQPVRLLDGVFLAVRADTLLRTGLRFDPRFRFHHYDLDFCRSAAAAGLSLGTWPIAVTHSSMGAFDTAQWKASLELYRAKWAAAES